MKHIISQSAIYTCECYHKSEPVATPKASHRTPRNSAKRPKNRSTRVHPGTVRLLGRFPLTSNDLPTVASLWWNVLAVRERVRSPQSRAFSGSQRTPRAFNRRLFHQSAGQPLEK